MKIESNLRKKYLPIFMMRMITTTTTTAFSAISLKEIELDHLFNNENIPERIKDCII